MFKTMVASGFGVFVGVVSPCMAFAQSGTEQGDIDCKVILCLAGGFPTGCSDALSYMLDRISPPHPKPPFGFCPMSNGEGYRAYDAPYARLNTNDRSGWDCAEGKNLSFALHEQDHGRTRIEAFCYTHATTRTYREDRETITRVIYSGRSSAIPVNFQIQITMEPNTPQAYASPTYKMNYNTGYFRAVSDGTGLTAPAEGG